MSTGILGALPEISGSESGKRINVSNYEDLSDFVRRVMSEKNLSQRLVSERSGGNISSGYVNDIIQRKTINPSVSKITALARGLGVSEDELIAIARGKETSFQPKEKIAVLFHKFNETDDEDLIDMEPILTMIEAELERRKRLREARGI